MLSFFSLNGWALAFLLALGGWVLSARALRRREALHRDLATAFAARADGVALGLAARLSENDERLWRRLITARGALEGAERDALRARRELEDVLASLQDAVLVVDDEARLRFLNASALRLFDARIESVLGAHLVEALPSFGLDDAVRAALRDGQSSAQELHLYSPQMREMFLRVAPVYSGAGTKAGAVAILQDLTELRRLERVRRDFVANASHELRTPIASIRAVAETLGHAPSDPHLVARFVPPLIEEAERLSSLVSDLLDLARAEGAQHAPFAPIALAEPVSRAVERLRAKAQRHDIEVRWQPPAFSPRVSGEANGLEQVAFNLLDNALSYTPSGGRVELRLSQRDAAEVRFEVSDTGTGIPAADLPRVFERFYRVDKARSRAEGGTGLGLAIVKHIVENHAGHVEVQSELGRGTTFRVQLPALAPREDAPAAR